ncbi:MAG: bacterial Ig-like domain-containing protein [Clostridia bacterium]|nr:bacterial Ig-like domain-containing protein [Clostridia bacterium]
MKSIVRFFRLRRRSRGIAFSAFILTAIVFATAVVCCASAGDRYVVTADHAVLLAYPAADAGVLAYVPQDTVLTALSDSGAYITASYEGSTGYVALDSLELLAESKPDGVSDVYVSRLPDRLTYVEGDDVQIDVTGLELTAVYSDGSTGAVSGATVLAPALVGAGEKTVTVVWTRPGYTEEHVCEFTVTLEPLPVSSLSIETLPVTDYIDGQFADFSGLTLRAGFSDGREDEVFSAADKPQWVTMSIPDGEELVGEGEKTVRVEYMYPEISAEFTVTVAPKRILSLTLVSPPSKLAYFTGEAIDPEGLVLEAEYSNGRTYTVTDYTLSPSVAADDTKNVRVIYEGLAVTFELAVTPLEIASIELREPTVLRYRPGRPADFSDMIVYAVYNSGAREVVTDYEVSEPDTSTVGRKTVRVTWNGFYAEFRLIVTEDYIPGDVDMDGSVTAADARLTLRAAILLETLDAQRELIADHDGDEEITTHDARLILRKALGIGT